MIWATNTGQYSYLGSLTMPQTLGAWEQLATAARTCAGNILDGL
jgi:hypothetical protein